LAFLIFAYLVVGPKPLAAAPTGGVVTSGTATITAGQQTIIRQYTNNAIINWNSFGINPGELVQFIQPSALSAVLNRVVGTDPSLILGSLQANGRVFLLNPNGILFGKTAQINVGSLMASTLSMKDSDFLNGSYIFAQDPAHALASVVNQGTIAALPGGYVVLIAPIVDNEGTISAPSGQVRLAAGTNATVSFDPSGVLDIALSGNANPQDVTMTPGAVSDLLTQVVNTKALVQAGSVVQNADGTVTLKGAEGLALNNGTISADAIAGSNAGNIEINSTQATVLANASLLTANGNGLNSNGGHIRIYSIGDTLFSGTIESQGGTSGNGGLVETSAEQNLYTFGNVVTTAQNGATGTWLLDPIDVTIVDAAAGGTQDGNIPTIIAGQTGTVSTGSLAAQLSNISITSTNDIVINDLAPNVSGVTPGGILTLHNNVNFTLTSNNGNVTFANTANTIKTQGTGTISINAGPWGSGHGVSLGNLVTAGGTIGVITDGDINVYNALNAGAGNVSLLTYHGNIVNAGSALLTTGYAILQAGGNIGTGAAPLNINTTGIIYPTTTLAGATIDIQDTNAASATVSMAMAGAPSVGNGDAHVYLNNGTTNYFQFTTGGVLSSNGTAGVPFALTNAGPIAIGTLSVGTGSSISATGATGDITDSGSAITVSNGSSGSISFSAGGNNGIGTAIAPINFNTTGSVFATTTTAGASMFLQDTNAANPQSVFMTTNGAPTSNSFLYTKNGVADYTEFSSAGVLSTTANFASNLTFHDTSTTTDLGIGSISLVSGNAVSLTSSDNITSSGANINTGTGTVALTATNNIQLGAITGNPVTITATNGNITSDGVAATNITATTATLTALTGIGTVGTPVATAVTTLTTSSTTNGTAGTYLSDSIAPTTFTATTYNSDVSLTGPSTFSFVGAGTTLAMNMPTTTVTFSNEISLASGGPIFNLLGTNNITAQNLTLKSVGSIGTLAQPLLTNVSNSLSLYMSADSPNGSTLYVTNSGALNTLLLSVGDAGWNTHYNNQVIWGAGGTNTLTYLTNNILDSNSSGTNVTFENDYATTSIDSIVAGAANTFTFLCNYSVLNNQSSPIAITAGTLKVDVGVSSSYNFGTAAAPMTTQVGTLTNDSVDLDAALYVTNSGNISVPYLKGWLVPNVPLNITTTAGGNISVGSLTGAVTLNAAGSILFSSGTITSSATNLTAVNGIGTALNPILLTNGAAGTLNLTTTGAGAVDYLTNSGAALSSLNVTTNNSTLQYNGPAQSAAFNAGTSTLTASLSGASLTFNNTGGNIVTGATTTGASAMSLTASGSITYGAGTLTAGNLSLSGTSLGTAGTALSGTITGTLTATATGAGGVTNFSNVAALTGVTDTTNNGNVTIAPGSGQSVNFNAGTSNLTASLSGVPFTFSNTGGNITTGNITTGASDANLTASGSINGGGGTITSNNLTLSGTLLGTGTAISGAITGTLNATASNGGISYANTGTFTAGTITATGAGNSVGLYSTVSILGGGGSNITSGAGGGGIALTAFSGNLGSTANPINVNTAGWIDTYAYGATPTIDLQDTNAATPSTIVFYLGGIPSVANGDANIYFNNGVANYVRFSTGGVLSTNGVPAISLSMSNNAGAVAIGSVSVGLLTVQATTNITSSGSAITATGAQLTAWGGSVGTTASPININATAGAGWIVGQAAGANGSIHIQDTNAANPGSVFMYLNGTPSVGNGNADIFFNNGVANYAQFDTTATLSTNGMAGIGLTVNNSGGNIIAGNINTGASATSLTASGTITYGSGTITAGNLTLSGTSLGTAGTALSGTISGTLAASASNGLINFSNGNNALAVGIVSAAGAGNDVTLSSGSAAMTSSASNITGGNLSLTGSSITALAGNVTGTLTTTTSGAGGVTSYTNTGALTGVTDTTNNGNVTISANAGAQTVNFNAGTSTLTTSLAGVPFTFNNTGGNIVTGAMTTGASATSLTSSGSITYGAGTITAGNLSLSGTSLGTAGTALSGTISGTLTTLATGAGGVTNFTNVAALTGDTNTTNNGNVTIAPGGGQSVSFNAGTSNLTASLSGVPFSFTNTGGSINVSNVNTGVAATTLNASTSIQGGATGLTAGTANLIAGTNIGVTTILNTTVSTLNATTTNGRMLIANTGDVTLGTVSVGGANDLFLTVSGAVFGTAVPVVASSNIYIRSWNGIGTAVQPLLTNTTSLQIQSLLANSPIYLTNSVNLGLMDISTNDSDVHLTANAGAQSMTFTGGGVDTLTYSMPGPGAPSLLYSNSGGAIYNVGAGTSNAYIVHLTATGNIGTALQPFLMDSEFVSLVNSNPGATIYAQDTASGGAPVRLGIASAGDVHFTNVNTDLNNAGSITTTGNAFITDTGGSILSPTITANAATLTATGTIGAGGSPLSTTVNSLTTIVTGAGGVTNVTNTSALTSDNNTTNNGNVTISANAGAQTVNFNAGTHILTATSGGAPFTFNNTGGTIALGNVNAGAGTATITSSGAMTFNAGAVTGGNVSLTGSSLGTGPSNLQTVSTGTITLQSTAVGGQIYVTNTGAPTDISVQTVNRSSAVSYGDSLNLIDYLGGGFLVVNANTANVTVSAGGGAGAFNQFVLTSNDKNITVAGGAGTVNFVGGGIDTLTANVPTSAFFSLTNLAGGIFNSGVTNNISLGSNVYLEATTGIGAVGQHLLTTGTGALTTVADNLGSTTYLDNTGAFSSMVAPSTNNGLVAITGTGQSVNFNPGTSNLTASLSGVQLWFSNTGGNITTGNTTTGASAMTLQASGSITNGGGTVTAGNLSLGGTSLGTAGTAITGNISGTLSAAATNGLINYSNGNNALAVGVISAAGAGNDVTLSSGTAAMTSSASNITGRNLSLTGSSITALAGNVTGTLTTLANGAGGITSYTNTGAITGDTNTTNNGNVTISGNAGAQTANFNAGTSHLNANTAGAPFTFSNTGGDIVTDNVNAGAGSVSLTTSGTMWYGSGNITGGNISLTGQWVGLGLALQTVTTGTITLHSTSAGLSDNVQNTGSPTSISIQTVDVGPFGTTVTYTDGSNSVSSVAGNLTLTAANANITLNSGAGSYSTIFAVTGDKNVSLTSGANTLNFVGGGTDTLTANLAGTASLSVTNSAGGIYNSGGANNISIGAASMTLQDTAGIGTAGQHLLTTSTGGLVTVAFNAGTGTYLDNTGALSSITNITNNGTVAITGTGQTVNFNPGTSHLNANTAGAPFTFNNFGGNVILDTVNAGAGAVSLTSSGTITYGSGSVTGGNISMTGSSVGAIGTALQTVTTGTMTLHSTAIGGAVWINNTGSPSNISIFNADATSWINFSDGGTELISSSGLHDLDLATTNSNVTVNSGGSYNTMILTSADKNVSVTGGAGTVNFVGGGIDTLTANVPGSILLEMENTAGGIYNSGVTNNISSGTLLILFASNGIGTAGQHLLTTSTSDLFTTTTNAGATTYLDNTGALTGFQIVTNNGIVAITGTGQNVNFNPGTSNLTANTAGANFSLNNIGGNITTGNINSGAAATTLIASGSITNGGGTITSNNLTMSGTSLGAAGLAINGNIAGTLTATASNGLINFSNGNNALAVGAISAAGAGNDVTLSSGTAAMTSAASNVTGRNLSLTGGSITGLNGNVTGTLTTVANGAGGVTSYTNTGALTGITDTTNNGNVTISANAGAQTVNFNSGTSLLTATTGGLPFTFSNSGGNIASGAINSGASNTSLTASGAITYNAGTITANTVTLNAGTSVGTAVTPISTSASNLNGTASAGGFFDANTGAVGLGNIQANGAGHNVVISNTGGNMLSNGAITSTGGNVNLTSTNDIDQGAAGIITAAGSSTLNAGGIIDPLQVNIGGILTTIAGGSVAGTSIQVAGVVGGGGVPGGAAPGEGFFNGVCYLNCPSAPAPPAAPAPPSSGSSSPLVVVSVPSVPAGPTFPSETPVSNALSEPSRDPSEVALTIPPANPDIPMPDISRDNNWHEVEDGAPSHLAVLGAPGLLVTAGVDWADVLAQLPASPSTNSVHPPLNEFSFVDNQGHRKQRGPNEFIGFGGFVGGYGGATTLPYVILTLHEGKLLPNGLGGVEGAGVAGVGLVKHRNAALLIPNIWTAWQDSK